MSRLVRDRVSWLLYAQQGAYGYFLYAITPSVALLSDELGMSRTVAGLYGPALAVGTIIGGSAYPALARRFRPGILLSAALVGATVAVALLCSLKSVPGTLAATVLVTIFTTQVVNGGTTAITMRHGSAAGAAMSEATAVSVGLGLLAPLLLDTAIRLGLGWRPGLAATTVVTAAVAVATVRMRRRLDPTTADVPAVTGPVPAADAVKP